MRRTISMILALVMLLSTVAFATGSEAVTGEVDSTPQVADLESENSSNINIPADGDISEFRRIGAEVLDEEDLFISEEVATYIAQFFIRDMVDTQTTKWDDETHIVKTTNMYDETGKNITAYTFELNKGYIVIAAHVDAPELIPEWSDEGQPVYKNLDLDSDDKVVFLGVFDYFADTGKDTLKSIDGVEVSRNEVVNIFGDARHIENIRGDLLADMVEQKCSGEVSKEEVSLFSSVITDPFEHAAQTIYGGKWTATEWANNWEQYASFANQSDFPDYPKACGPIAITNLIKMYGGKYLHYGIAYSSHKSVFSKIMDLNDKQDRYNKYYHPYMGTYKEREADFIKNSFAIYGVTVKIYGEYDPTFTNIKNCTSAKNKLMYLYLCYGSTHYTQKQAHTVVGYAYTRLQSESFPYIWYSYVKIADGWNSSARYLYIGDLQAEDNYFWEVYFY